MSIEIFVSYADTNKDERLWKALEVHLSPFYGDHNGNTYLWNPHKNILPGSNRKREISAHLQSAQIFLLLLSPDYFADPECRQQMNYALSLKDQVQLVPVLLRPCSWQGLGLNDLQIVPRDKKPVTRQADFDEAWTQVTEEIQNSIDFLGKKNASNRDDGAVERSEPMPGDTFNVNANKIDTSIVGHDHHIVINNDKASASAPRSQDTNKTSGDQDEVVDIGIIIALREEFSIFFKEITVTGQVRDEQTGEIYYRFERSSSRAARPYRCVATMIGGMGSTRAALQAERMLVRWHLPTLVLPGLAASLDKDALLGDIVVANQVDGYMENTRANPSPDQQGYELRHSGEVYRPASELLQRVRNFEFASDTTYQAWLTESIELQQQLLVQYADLKQSGMLRDQPQILEGHIASGPVVGAAQEYTTWLKQRDRKLLALEMEAFGVMEAIYHQVSTNNTSALILRAISDFGDENKSNLDAGSKNAIRRYAMLNAIHLLWKFLDAGLLPQTTM